MVWVKVFTIFALLLNYASAYNVETSESYQLYLRDGGYGSYNASQEPAYAGYTFDVKKKNNITQILVGQPRSGVEGQVTSSGSIYNCNFTFTLKNEELGSGVDTTSSTTGTSDFTSPYCNDIDVFDQKNLKQRSTDHKNDADAMGLNLGRIGNSDRYAVCAPMRQRSCPDARYAPGACYYGAANQSQWTFLQWDETECFNDIIEIMFVVDGSNSIKDKDFAIVRSWLINTTRALIETYGEAVRTEVLQYSNKDPAKDRLPIELSQKFVIPYVLDDVLTIEERAEKINNMRHLKSQTFTYYALRRAMEVEFPNSQFYKESTKVVVVLTDGEANDGSSLDNWYRKYENEMTPYAIGVGDYGRFLKQLNNIAHGVDGSGTALERVLTANDFEELQNVISSLTDLIESSVGNEGSVSNSSQGPKEDTRSRQLGTAIASDENGTVYVGAVGMYQDSGVVMKFDNFSENGATQPTYQEVQQALPNRTTDSYMGYSVITAFFDGPTGSEYVATGAPRYMLQGAVVVYNPVAGDGAFHNRVTIRAPPNRRQFGAYFGGSLLSVDINGDGKNDLFVSSPLYVGANYDEGRVFVYISQDTESPKTWAESSYNPIELSGDHSVGGRFGTAMANAGDLNLDGYDDVIIGAPLADGGQGAVFIYHGMKGTISNVPSQKIHASALNEQQLKYFGQSLQGGVDIDENQYPDIFVGAPRSDSVVILRSRPIVKIFSTIRFTGENIDIFECKSLSYKNCTALEVCFSANGTAVDSSIEINYNLTIDSEKSSFGDRRLEFATMSTTTTQIARELSLLPGSEYCFTEQVSAKKGVDYKDPVAAKLDFDLTQSHLNTLFSPVRDPTLPNTRSTNITFFTHCESDICLPDLKLDGVMTLPAFQRNGTDFTENGEILIVDSYSADNNPTLRLNLSNTGENAFDVLLNVTYSNKVILTGPSTSGYPSSQCSENVGSTKSQGEWAVREFRFTQEVMRKGHWCFFEFQVLAADQLKDDGTTENFTIKVESYSKSGASVENNTMNNSWEKTTKLKYRSDVNTKRSSGITGDQEMEFNYTTGLNITSVGDIGVGTPDITVAFTIEGLGYSNIPLSELTLKWPSLSEEKTPLLYLYSLECNVENQGQSTGKCVCDLSNVNPKNLTIDGEVTGELLNVTQTNNIVDSDELNCDTDRDASHQCESLKCTVYDLKASVQISFKAFFRLWTPSITFNETERGSVRLLTDFEVSTAKSPLVIGSDFESIILLKEEVTTTAKKYVVVQVHQPGIADWIILIAVIAGVVALVIIIFVVLTKLGCFENKYGKKLQEERDRLDEETNFPDRAKPDDNVDEIIDATITPGHTYENMQGEDDPDYDLPPDASS